MRDGVPVRGQHPERTTALVLFQPAWEFPIEPGEIEGLADVRERWGTQEFSDELLAEVAPSLAATRTTAPGSRTGCAWARARRQPTR
jgi:hypothetical protein